MSDPAPRSTTHEGTSGGHAFGDGLAQGPDLLAAAETAVAAATAPLAGRRPDLLGVFVSHPDPDTAAAAGARAMEVAGATTAFGCRASGVIGDGRGIEDTPAVAVWAATLPDVRVTPFRLQAARHENGISVGGMPMPADDDAVAVLLADPFTFPAQGFVEQSDTALGGLPLIGGLATAPTGTSALGPGRPAPGGARLFLDGETHSGGAVGVMLGGAVAVRTLVSQGCRPIGPTMTVTEAGGSELHALAGTPAYRKLEEILRDLSEEDRELALRGLHLGVAIDEYAEAHGRGDFLIRGVVGADEDTGTVTVGDVVEVGTTVRFHVRDATTAGEDLDALMAATADEGPVGGALLFSCTGRGRVMFGEPDSEHGGASHDVRAVRRGLAPRVAGFFADGEIGPVASKNHLHGFTASVLAFE
jgi:small ligand-binding sensory domain FIST